MKRYLTKRRVLEWCAAQTKGVTDMKKFSLVIEADTSEEVLSSLHYAYTWALRNPAVVDMMHIDDDRDLSVPGAAAMELTFCRTE